MEILAAVVVWFILGCITGGIAWNRGHSFGAWLCFGLLLFPIALPLALTLPRNVPALDRRREAEGQWKHCPRCAEFVRLVAAVCPYCGGDVSVVPTAADNVPVPPPGAPPLVPGVHEPNLSPVPGESSGSGSKSDWPAGMTLTNLTPQLASA